MSRMGGGVHLLGFQLFIQGLCQLQHHGTGHGRISGAVELPLPLGRVVLGVMVAGEDQAALGRRVQSRDDVIEGQAAVGRPRHKFILRYFPTGSERTQGGFDVL